MARPLQPIRFDPSGVSRGFNVPVNVAYDLENCYIDRQGKVNQLNAPRDYTPAGGAPFQQGKPYFEWNSELIDAVQSDSGAAASTITGPLGTNDAFEVFSGDSHAINLVLSGRTSDTNGTNADGYATYVLQPDYDHDTNENDNLSVESAWIHHVAVQRWEPQQYESLSGVAAGEAGSTGATANQFLWTDYLLIPYNKRGEAGPWFFVGTLRNFTVLTTSGGAGDPYRFLQFVDLRIDGNDEIDHIDIYSTMSYDYFGASSIERYNAIDSLAIDDEVLKWETGAKDWWYRTTVKPTEVTLASTRYQVRWTDQEYLLASPLFEQLLLAKTTGIVGAAGLDYFVHTDVETNFDVRPVFRTPNRLLDQERNLHRVATVQHLKRRQAGDNTDDQLAKDAGGAGTHHLIFEGDLTSDITAGDIVYILNEYAQGWTGAYGVDSLSYSGATLKTTIVSSNFTSAPAATLNPVPGTVDLLYFTGSNGNLARYDGFAARTMFNHNGVMLYGNVTTGKPDVKQNISNIEASLSAGDKYGAMFEYFDENGEIGTGPFLAPITDEDGNTDLDFLQVAWNGELALQIWKYDGSGDDSVIANYTLMERLPATGSNFFETTALGADGTKLRWSYFRDNPDRNDETPVTYKTPGAGYYTLPNVAYLSDVNRPMELTYNRFVVPRDESIRAITPVRLEEEEGVQSYDFYVFTDKSVRVYERDGLSVRQVQIMLNDAGVKLVNTDDIGVNAADQTPDTRHPLVATFEGGAVFVSTDDRVYAMSGRRIKPMDEDVRGLFSTTWKDIAYHEQENEIWIATSANEIWVYDLELSGWNKNYTLNSNWAIQCLFYSEVNQEMLMYLNTDVSGGPTYDTYIFDNGGSGLTTGIATQELSQDGQLMSIARLVVDYERTSYSASNRAKLLHYVDARTDGAAEDLLDVLESNAKKRIEYLIPRQKGIYPALVGRRHQLKVSEFTSLDSIMIATEIENELI